MDGFSGSGVIYGLLREESQNSSEHESHHSAQRQSEDSTMSEARAQRRRYRKLLVEREDEEEACEGEGLEGEMKCHCQKSKCLRCQDVKYANVASYLGKLFLKSVNLALIRVCVEGIFEQMSSPGWSRRTAVAATQRSQAGLMLGYHALFCLARPSQ